MCIFMVQFSEFYCTSKGNIESLKYCTTVRCIKVMLLMGILMIDCHARENLVSTLRQFQRHSRQYDIFQTNWNCRKMLNDTRLIYAVSGDLWTQSCLKNKINSSQLNCWKYCCNIVMPSDCLISCQSLSINWNKHVRSAHEGVASWPFIEHS